MNRVKAFPDFPTSEQRRLTHFEYLCRAIVYQQLAGSAASAIYGRFCELGDGRPPAADKLLRISERRLRGAGLSQNKLRSLRDLARHIDEGLLNLRGIGRLHDEDVVEKLLPVRGIGVWTAQMFLIFKLGRLDVMPCGDLGVQEGLRRLEDLTERPGPKELEERAHCWAPLRTVAAWVLWRLTEVENPS